MTLARKLKFVCAITGAEVTAGTVNIDGKLRVQVKKAGNATTMADILRLVEAAQARTAPAQRLADSVAGKFAVGVMAASAMTLTFWLTAGPILFPKACYSRYSCIAFNTLALLFVLY